jgi:hypothetical protein
MGIYYAAPLLGPALGPSKFVFVSHSFYIRPDCPNDIQLLGA